MTTQNNGNTKAICSNCIMDFGLKEVINSSAESSLTCSICEKIGTHTVTLNNLTDILEQYFGTGGLSQIYRHRTFLNIDGDFEQSNLDYPLQDTLIADLKNIGRLFNQTVRSYMPRMAYAFGGTEIYFELEELSANNINDTIPYFDKLTRLFKVIEFSKDENLFRIRKFCSPDNPPSLLDSEFDTPPEDISTKYSGRLNSDDNFVFYCSQEIETCLFESKFQPTDYLVAAICQSTQQLRLLDLSEFLEDELYDSITGKEMKWNKDEISSLIHGFFNGQEYKYLQIWSKVIRNHGFDGIKYPSFFNRYGIANKYSIAVFGYPIKDNKLKIISKNRIQLNDIQFNWGWGPAIDINKNK